MTWKNLTILNQSEERVEISCVEMRGGVTLRRGGLVWDQCEDVPGQDPGHMLGWEQGHASPHLTHLHHHPVLGHTDTDLSHQV